MEDKRQVAVQLAEVELELKRVVTQIKRCKTHVKTLTQREATLRKRYQELRTLGNSGKIGDIDIFDDSKLALRLQIVLDGIEEMGIVDSVTLADICGIARATIDSRLKILLSRKLCIRTTFLKKHYFSVDKPTIEELILLSDVKSISLKVLKVLLEAPQPMSERDIRDKIGASQETTYSILAQLSKFVNSYKNIGEPTMYYLNTNIIV